MIEKGITEIENALEKAVRRDCSSNVTVSFSGGIDSTLVAYLAKKHTDVELIAVGIEDSHDIEAAKSAAKLIDSDLVCLPHPSGLSTWYKKEPGKSLLEKALCLIEKNKNWKSIIRK